MAARQERLQKLFDRRAELDAQIERIKTAEAKENRKRDARRKILLGAMVLGMVECGKWRREDLQVELDGFLTRDHDRALFDLPPRSTAERRQTETTRRRG